MELKEFIKQTIIDVTDGLMEGQKYIIANNYGEGIDDGYKRIKFDIAVTSQDENRIGGGGKISVVNIFSAKGEIENTNTATNFSRIQFETLIAVRIK
ncbi:hypothetical protein FO440_08500 [Mucilaginibacter corticis]|uniref:Uncharacterized protein n=1 Tax=Mucilaginibacter corticis TaxID=2597670 RepID=A0A556MWL1_9SPHI|nr:hypothetical protein [Mucilaginibacter corticis]TSJ44198.1 hypothetical protein FO440_08500 [Mucilaginibacter corticis]